MALTALRSVLLKNRRLVRKKKTFHGLTRAKYYPQACLKQTGLFLKNNKPKPFDGIIREICHPFLADKSCNL